MTQPQTPTITEELAQEAALVIGYCRIIREHPETARGFGRLAEKHAERLVELALRVPTPEGG